MNFLTSQHTKEAISSPRFAAIIPGPPGHPRVPNLSYSNASLAPGLSLFLTVHVLDISCDDSKALDHS